MEKNIENTIKGRIAECVAEELFKELNFFVIKFGQEHQVEPITQLQGFIEKCDGNFKLKYGRYEKWNSFDYVRRMPDFVIVKNNFEPELLEVKYRTSGIYIDKVNGLKDNDIIELFEYYPTARLLLIVNKSKTYFTDCDFKDYSELKRLKATNFQILYEELNKDDDSKDDLCQLPLTDWLKKEYNIPIEKSTSIIEKYEKLVDSWLNR